MLNKNLVELNGAGKTIHLLCKASTLSQQASLQVYIDGVKIVVLMNVYFTVLKMPILRKFSKPTNS